MNANFLEAQDICIEHATQISDLLGLSDGMARILALLYMSPEAVSIPAICEKLALTKGTVSLYLRLLEERRIIVRSWSKRQGKQKFYEINPRLWTDFMDDFRNRARRRLEITEDAIERSEQAILKDEREYDGEDRLVSRLLLERLGRIREINELSRAALEHFLVRKNKSQADDSGLKKIEFSDD